MAANTAPIYSRQGDVQGGDILFTGVNDYTGQSTSTVVVFASDLTNGGFVQRLRFKAAGGTTNATSARIYYNNGQSRFLGQAAAPTAAPTGTPSISGGTLSTGTFFGRVVTIDGYGGKSAAGLESATVNVTGPSGSITWNWVGTSGAASYRLYVGPTTNGQLSYFTTTTTTLVQTTSVGTRDNLTVAVSNNNTLIGELSLPIVAASSTAGTIDIDYPLNFALPPGGRILVCLSNTVTGGWIVTAIGGEY